MSRAYALELEKDGVEFPLRSASAGEYRLPVDTEPVGVSMTREEFAEECDINQIMARYEKTGMLPVNGSVPQYVDFTAVPDNLQMAMLVMMEAETAFSHLPASVRKEFDNDAVRFVEFASDGSNIGKLREWGLAAPEKVPDPPMRVEVINAAPPEGDNRSPPAPAGA